MSWFRVTVIGRAESTEVPFHAICGGADLDHTIRRAMQRVKWAMSLEGVYLATDGPCPLEVTADLSVLVTRWSCYEDFSKCGVDGRQRLLATRLHKLGGPSSGLCSPSALTGKDCLEPPLSSS